MRFGEGSPGQRGLFFLLVGLYLLGVAVFVADKLERVGQPDPGWVMDGADITPTRFDAALAGLGGGGRALRLNGQDVSGYEGRSTDLVRREPGATNELRLQRADGEILDLSIATRAWTWTDVLFSNGLLGALGLLLAGVGIGSFLLRPFETTSWAMLALTTLFGGLVSNLFLPMNAGDTIYALYFRAVVGLAAVVPIHAGLAFPVVHELLRRRPQVLRVIYGGGIALSALECAAWWNNFSGALAITGVIDSTVLLGANAFFIGRCGLYAVRTADPLLAQRARILLAGLLFGAGPPIVANFLRVTVSWFSFDRRFVMVFLLVFVAALARVTVSHDLMNARAAARRAVIFGGVVVLLTLIAMLLVSVTPYLVGLLILPLLYWWPSFYQQLDARMFPKRARFPELVREIGAELAGCDSLDAVLELLAEAPRRICDARSAVAFLLANSGDSGERMRSSGPEPLERPGSLAREPLVQLVVTTRKEVFRSRIALESQYSNIQQECHAGFERLHAEVLLPILNAGQVAGALALGPRETGESYEKAELDALSTLALGAMQAIERVEATERLRSRESEFSELKRFFPPQIIAQVMERGGARELRSQRKLVTVFFADLRGFTSFSDRVEPEEVMNTLGEYHEAMGKRIAEFVGTLERFAGDGFMVFFNDPVEQADHVERAARMALAMRRDVAELRRGWSARGYAIDVGMGMHSGYATCGFIGYEGRRDYGVIGNVTNLAARLSDAAEGGEILVSHRVHAELANTLACEPAGELVLKGFSEPQAVWRLVG